VQAHRAALRAAIAADRASQIQSAAPVGQIVQKDTFWDFEPFIAWEEIGEVKLYTAPQPDRAPFTAESIDTPEFRKMMDALGKWDDVACRDTIIAHIDAQLAEARSEAKARAITAAGLEAMVHIYKERSESLEKELAEARRAPVGWKLVPLEPTYQMCEAGQFKWEQGEGFPTRYRAMLAASPSPDQAQAGEEGGKAT